MNSSTIKKKYWYNNTWLQLIVAYLFLSPIGSAIYENYKNVPVFSIVLSYILKPWNLILNILILKFEVWVYLLFLITLTGLYYLLKKYVFNKSFIQSNTTTTSKPIEQFLTYRSDSFRNYQWTWNYANLGNGSYQISNLQPHCPNDNAPLMKNHNGLICSKCGQSFNYPYPVTQVLRQWQYDGIISMIKHNVRTNFDKILV